jgi:hypothetical protein
MDEPRCNRLAIEPLIAAGLNIAQWRADHQQKMCFANALHESSVRAEPGLTCVAVMIVCEQVLAPEARDHRQIPALGESAQ